MPNPGSFLGARFDFLHAQKRQYAAAVVANSKSEFVSDVHRRYFKRFPIELDHGVDPTQEFLDTVNDEEADPEVVAPDPSLMSPEEYEKAEAIFKKRQDMVVFRKQVSLGTCCLIPVSGDAFMRRV